MFNISSTLTNFHKWSKYLYLIISQQKNSLMRDLGLNVHVVLELFVVVLIFSFFLSLFWTFISLIDLSEFVSVVYTNHEG